MNLIAAAQRNIELMKKLAILLCAFGAYTANAQTTSTERLIETTGAKPGKQASTLSLATKQNEIVKGNVAYNGIAVQILKTSNPLQLVNPAAPARYGSAEDNLMRDPITGRGAGLRIFCIRF
jgi:hypothetical protein